MSTPQRPLSRSLAWRVTVLRLSCVGVLFGLLATSAHHVVAAPPQQSQSQPPPGLPPVTFRTEVRFIEVDAFVTDASGTPVSDLKQDEFELYEDGSRQTIESFSSVDLPIERAVRALYSPKAIEPDVKTNEGGEGRVYLILLDDIHVHPSRVPFVRAALHEFIERNFGTNDLAAVVRVRNSRDTQDFTNNPRLLLKAIDAFTGNVPGEKYTTTSATPPADPLTTPAAAPQGAAAAPAPQGNVAVAAAAAALSNTPGAAAAAATPADLEIAKDARDVASRLRELSEFLAGVRGRRKALLFVSEGSPFDTYSVMGQTGTTASRVIEDTRAAIAAATRGNVTVYAIDPRGLTPSDTNELSALEAPSTVGQRLAQDGLRELAYETGGFASVNMNELSRTFERIVRENSSYYILGYSPSNERRDGSYRRLEVRVKRPGVQVRARNGYTSSSERAPEPAKSAGLSAVAAAIASPLPTSGGLPLRVFAAPYRGPAPKATVMIAIEVDGSKVDFIERDGLFVQQLEIAHGSSDATGRRHPPIRYTMNLSLKRAMYDRVRFGGLRVLSQLDLPPGRHQLRVAASTGEGKVGSVFYDLEVPDFSRESFSMSGLSLTSSRSADAVTVVTKSPLLVGSGTPLVTSRLFDNGDTVGIFGEVYENQRKGAAHTIDIVTELRNDAGVIIAKSSETRSSSELKKADGGYGFTAVMPLQNLPSGIYVIHAEARQNIGTRPVVSRDVQIRVR